MWEDALAVTVALLWSLASATWVVDQLMIRDAEEDRANPEAYAGWGVFTLIVMFAVAYLSFSALLAM